MDCIRNSKQIRKSADVPIIARPLTWLQVITDVLILGIATFHWIISPNQLVKNTDSFKNNKSYERSDESLTNRLFIYNWHRLNLCFIHGLRFSESMILWLFYTAYCHNNVACRKSHQLSFISNAQIIWKTHRQAKTYKLKVWSQESSNHVLYFTWVRMCSVSISNTSSCQSSSLGQWDLNRHPFIFRVDSYLHLSLLW